ncbi:60S ribosomal protein L13, partial [Coemansia sp. RSA 2708]
YNRKVRVGRGFTREELQAAGISANYAATVGIAVDHRRRNRSDESLARNVQRLQEYLAKLVVLPRNVKQRTPEVVQAYRSAVQVAGPVVPLAVAPAPEAPRAVTAAEKQAQAFVTLRQAHGILKSQGKTEKRRAERKEAKANSVKK